MWTEILATDDSGIQRSVDLQREQSDWYNETVTFESTKQKLSVIAGYRVFYYASDDFDVQFVVKEVPRFGMYRLVTCAVRYNDGVRRPYLAAIVLLQKLRSFANTKSVYAVWDSDNPEQTMEFFSAVANSENALEANNVNVVTGIDPSPTGDFKNYTPTWII